MDFFKGTKGSLFHRRKKAGPKRLIIVITLLMFTVYILEQNILAQYSENVPDMKLPYLDDGKDKGNRYVITWGLTSYWVWRHLISLRSNIIWPRCHNYLVVPSLRSYMWVRGATVTLIFGMVLPSLSYTISSCMGVLSLLRSHMGVAPK